MGCTTPKQFLEVAGTPILAHTLSALSSVSFIARILVVVPEKHIPAAGRVVTDWTRTAAVTIPEIEIVTGGAQRQDSVYNGLLRLPSECEWVLIHDGVRPFASPGLITAAWQGARKTGASIVAVPATDTVKRAREETVLETIPRDQIWLVQTPQVFSREIIMAAYGKAMEAGWTGTDDASFVERLGVPVSIVHGERSNVKVTTPEDLKWAEWFLGKGNG
jgi:2-C-methyl-D-erythritol 4-phosphate cytidylyltransferase